MDGFDVFDLVMTVIIFVLTIGAATFFLLPTVSPRVSLWRTRRWLRRESGRDDRAAIEQVRAPLSADDRVRALGILVGFVVGVSLAPPSFGADEDNTPQTLVWLAAVITGLWLGRSLHLLLLARSATPPSGIRVATSSPHRASWYVSRTAFGLFVSGVATQIVFGVLQIRAVVPWDGGMSPSTLSALASMVGSLVIIVAVLVLVPWLLSRPLFAGDDAELDLEIRLRRDRISGLVFCIYPLVVLVQTLVYTIDTSNVPVEVRRQWDWTWLSPAALAFSFAGLLVQVTYSKRWERRGVVAQSSVLSSRPRTAGSPPAANAG